jgi:hypothetical protein
MAILSKKAYLYMCSIPDGFRNRATSLCSSADLATASIEEYRRRFPMRTAPDYRVFSKVFNTFYERGALPSTHVPSERARQQHAEKQENFLEIVLRSPTTSTRKLSTRLSVSRTHV